MRQRVSVQKNARSSGSLIKAHRFGAAPQVRLANKFVVWLNNKDYVAFFDPRKICRAFTDGKATTHGFIGVVDESGEDCLYPIGYFAPVALPKATQPVLALTF